MLVAGSAHGTVSFGGSDLVSAGGADVVVAQLDADGSHLWSQRFGDASYQAASGIAVDGSDQVLVAGYFQGAMSFGGGVLQSGGGDDIFVAQLDTDGEHLWSQRFGGPSQQYANAISIDTAGNVLVTGAFHGAVDFGGDELVSAGGGDIYVVKLDTDGAHLWSQRFGDAAVQVASAVAVDSADNVLVTGYFEGAVDFGGGELESMGGRDIFVAKLDPDGSHLWSQRFGDAAHQRAHAIALDAAGNVLVAGAFEGVLDLGGDELVCAGGDDLFVAKLDPAGAHVWSQGFGDSDLQQAHAIAVDSSANAVVIGSFSGTLNLGGDDLTSAGETDIFAASFAP